MNQGPGRPAANVLLSDIKLECARYFDVEPIELERADRKSEVALARHVALFIARSTTNLSLEEIGRAFDRRPAAVSYAVDRIEGFVRTRTDVADAVWRIGARLGYSPRQLGLPNSGLRGADVGKSIELFERFHDAKSIDIAVNTGENLVRDHLAMLARAIRHNECTVRIVVTDPKSKVVTDKKLSDSLCPGVDLEAAIEDVLRQLRALHDELRQEELQDMLQVGLRSSPPTCSMIIVDDQYMRLTPMLPEMHSDEVPSFTIVQAPDGLLDRYRHAFGRLWKAAEVDVGVTTADKASSD